MQFLLFLLILVFVTLFYNFLNPIIWIKKCLFFGLHLNILLHKWLGPSFGRPIDFLRLLFLAHLMLIFLILSICSLFSRLNKLSFIIMVATWVLFLICGDLSGLQAWIPFNLAHSIRFILLHHSFCTLRLVLDLLSLDRFFEHFLLDTFLKNLFYRDLLQLLCP